MGVDVLGRAPRTRIGGVYMSNWSWWEPLIEYLEVHGPRNVMARCQHWFSNDGDGLDDAGSLALADALEALVKSGHFAAYVGIDFDRHDALSVACGERKASDERQRSAEAGALDFVEFLRNCGGFEIW
jgi:hypothetical protein